MTAAISVANLGKCYFLTHEPRERYTALRDVLADGASRLARRLTHPLSKSGASGSREEFWALRDVAFDVQQGERVGVIGRNGAGKSTLLKLLSRVTEPSTGRIQLCGRVASLLEVGTGFHPELTGKENIFLNGVILGMSRAEIKRKFDEIVAFAEIERFLDTPVKRYSSGMYVRLAFAVAAHLEPEILVVDEVLAVGDAQFQKKCLGKMEEVGKQGRTVLFVSHNMQAILQLCGRAVLLRAGRIEFDGTPGAAIAEYLQEDAAGGVVSRDEFIRSLPEDPTFRLDHVRVSQLGNEVADLVESGKPLELRIEYEVRERVTGLRVYFDLCDETDTLLFRSFHDEDNDGIPTIEPGRYVSCVSIPGDLLGPAHYHLHVLAGIYNVRSCLPPSGVNIPLKVEHTGRANRAYPGDTFRAKLAPALDWKTEKRNRFD